MQPFVCPQCGRQSAFDPWAGPAHCPACGFTPPSDGMTGEYIQWAQRQAYQPYLDELLSHWNGSHEPERSFTLESADDALSFFRRYQRALGEDPRQEPNPQAAYVRDYAPTRQEILILVSAYLWLRRGQRERAEEYLAALTFAAPQFIDAWVWRSAATDDPQARLHFLHRATNLDIAHPLARDALALAEGRVHTGIDGPKEQIVVTKCPQCGAGLEYDPGAARIACPHCGHEVSIGQSDILNSRARAVHDLRLERRYQGRAWSEAKRVVACHTCGAELTMTEYLSRCCVFCGSTHVLVQDNQRTLEQPDGLLPFQIDREEAEQALRQALKRPAQRVQSWLSGASHMAEDLQGLYLPFWVFDGMVEAYRYNKSWATTTKETLGLTSHENLLFPAVDVPSPSLVQRVYPFDLGRLAAYDPRLLASWPARLYTRDVELVSEAARTAMLDRARQQVSWPLAGSDPGWRATGQSGVSQPVGGTVSAVAFQVIGTAYQLILLPLWITRVEGGGKAKTALINGQTGRVALAESRPEH